MAQFHFNGGKMNHIWKSVKGKYINEYTCENAKKCFENTETIATLKVDGECAAIIRHKVSVEKWEWLFYRRQDNYKGNDENIPLPDGTQPASFEKHNYSFVFVPKDLETGKGKRKSYPGRDTYIAIKNAVNTGGLPSANKSKADFITIEWVGKKHQLNRDDCHEDHGVVIHGDTIIDIPDRTFETLSEMAQNTCIEGIVLIAENGERFKIRFNMFPNSKWNDKTYPTTYKPIIYTANNIEYSYLY